MRDLSLAKIRTAAFKEVGSFSDAFLDTCRWAGAEARYFWCRDEIINPLIQPGFDPKHVRRSLDRIGEIFGAEINTDLPSDARTAIVGVTGFVPLSNRSSPGAAQPLDQEYLEVRAEARKLLKERVGELTCDDTAILAENLKELAANSAVGRHELCSHALLMVQAASSLIGECKNPSGKTPNEAGKADLYRIVLGALKLSRFKLQDSFSGLRNQLNDSWREATPGDSEPPEA